MPQFTHLHCHTQYSILDGEAKIDAMIAKAKADGMTAAAITDHGNMFGVYEFVNVCNKNDIKPIIGCEFYLVEDMYVTSFAGTGKKDVRNHQLLLAKNQIGYKNLCILTSLGYKEGLYSKWPRIDFNLLKKHSEGLIATTCCLNGIVPQTILIKGEEAGEKVFKEWFDIFGSDYYVELQRHELENIKNTHYSQEDINQILIKWGKKYDVPIIATNDSHYVDQKDYDRHDIMLCINTANKKSTPIKADDEDGSTGDTRFGFPNDQFFFKTTAEMEHIFKDIPEALENTQAIVDKVENIKLLRDIMMPDFQVPGEFKSQADFMRKLVYDGASKRYNEITQDIIDRIEMELGVIFNAKYEGYFLVIEDFLKEAKRMNVLVGPGRGSAAGSVVSYCLGITHVDPLQYGLLFERFLNPERVSFPDIDIDFEDEGRQKVLDYVVNKYGKNKVAQIVTYGTMKEKMAIRDVGRVLELPLADTNMLAKAVPDIVDVNLEKILDDQEYKDYKKTMRQEDIQKSEKLREYYKDRKYHDIIDYAIQLKGSVRNVGVHACGVIIAPEDLQNLIPLSVSKDSEIAVSQYDKDIVESVGLLKMDFLGLKTLSILKDIISLIERRQGIVVDIDNLPLDDAKTFEIFQNGQTDGIFQFESIGMKKNLIKLKPDRFQDLIAMNALYRPGPMRYIPNYIDRKHGHEEVQYDIEASKEILQETFGIMVYQEQVTQLSQVLANFTKGQADTLRKAMGKKDLKTMEKLYEQFINGCVSNNHPQQKADKIWNDMKDFAQYAFNKSHSTCYAYIAYQTAYLKANFPHEFMAGLISNNMNNLDDVKNYIQVSRDLGIDVIGPDVNESDYKFAVNKNNQIRFGLSAIKGVGEKVIQNMVAERESGGPFKDVYDFITRLDKKTANKKVIEALAISGALDCFDEFNRRQYFELENNQTFIEKLLKFAQTASASAQPSTNLFGESYQDMVDKPLPPSVPEYEAIDRLEREKEVIGIYMSGHPLDIHRKIIEDISCVKYENHTKLNKTEIFIGMAKSVQMVYPEKTAPYMKFTLMGIEDSMTFNLRKAQFSKFKDSLVENETYMIYVTKKSFISKEDNQEKEYMFIESISPIDRAYEMVRKLVLKVNLLDMDEDTIDKLKYELSLHPGNVDVFLNFEIPVQHTDEDTQEDYTVFTSLEIKSLNYKVKVDLDFLNKVYEIFDIKNVTILFD